MCVLQRVHQRRVICAIASVKMCTGQICCRPSVNCPAQVREGWHRSTVLYASCSASTSAVSSAQNLRVTQHSHTCGIRASCRLSVNCPAQVREGWHRSTVMCSSCSALTSAVSSAPQPVSGLCQQPAHKHLQTRAGGSYAAAGTRPAEHRSQPCSLQSAVCGQHANTNAEASQCLQVLCSSQAWAGRCRGLAGAEVLAVIRQMRSSPASTMAEETFRLRSS